MAEVKIIPALERSAELVRTAAYARVSSDSDDQLNSFSAQIRYYTEMLSGSTDTVFVDMYADEGITGTSTVKRTEFKRLMDDCRKGKIDRILTKSVSRFARNTRDCLEAVRELKTLGISVYFEKENIDTGELSSELLLAVHSQFAQEESLSISKNCRMGIKKRMADGTYITSHPPFGYKLIDGTLVVDSENAIIVRRIFDDYLHGIGMSQIAERLNREHIPCGEQAMKWHHSVINTILSNEKYIGDSIFQKTYVTDTLPYRQVKNNGEKPKYYVSHTHEPIISKEDFETVREIRLNRYQPKGYETETYPLSKIIKCGVCSSTFRRKKNPKTICWVCRMHDHEGKSKCHLKSVAEIEIYNAFIRMFSKLSANCKAILPQMIRQLQELADIKTSGEQATDLKRQLAEVKEQQHLIARLKAQGTLDEAYCTAKSTELDSRHISLQKRLRAMTGSDEERERISELKRLAELLQSTEPITEFDEILFAQTVEQIVVISDTELKFRLVGGLELTESISREGRRKC